MYLGPCQASMTHLLKELRNCVLCIIRAGSLVCSIRIYTSLHFLLIISGNSFSSFFVQYFCLFSFELDTFLNFYVTKGSVILFSLYENMKTNCKQKNRVRKNMLPERFWVFKKPFICKEKKWNCQKLKVVQKM